MTRQPLLALLIVCSACGDDVGSTEVGGLLVPRTVNINTADAAYLQTLPGIGPVTAARIVTYREEHGPFGAVDELLAVRGIGPYTLARLRGHVAVGPVVDEDLCERLDLNIASLSELDALPGIGPALAGRIVADREGDGPFDTVDALMRVRGIGPARVAAIRSLVRVSGPCGEAAVVAPEPELPFVRINEASMEELMTLPGVDVRAAQAIVDHVQTLGAFTTLLELQAVGVDTSGWDGGYSLATHRVYFTPFVAGGAGYADRNRDKSLPVAAEAGALPRVSAANIVNAFVDLVRRTPDGGLIQLGIYGYSTRTPEHEALVEAVERRRVRLQVVIDTSVKNSRGVPYSADEISALRSLQGEVEVRTLRYRSKTLHEKFAIFDGRHVINGSANISTRANTRYDETRMVFLNDEPIADAFSAEFERIFYQLGIEPEGGAGR